MIGSIITAVAAIAGTATSIATAAKASKQAEAFSKRQIESLASQKAASRITQMKTADIAGQGGLSAGQYNRALMQNDIFAMQAEGLVNKMEASPFSDEFRKEAFAKLALSDIKQFTRKTTQNLQDLDAQAIVTNAKLAMEGAGRLAEQERSIMQQEIDIQNREIEAKTRTFQAINNSVGALAKLTGATIKYGNEQGWFDSKGEFRTKSLTLDQNVAQSSGIGGGLNQIDMSVFDPAVIPSSSSEISAYDSYDMYSGNKVTNTSDVIDRLYSDYRDNLDY